MSGSSGPVTYDFTSRVGFVTGAAGDIGRSVALKLASSGARVALADLETARGRLEESAGQCVGQNGSQNVEMVTFDVSTAGAVESAVEHVVDRLGVPNLVFNGAGYQGAFVATPHYPDQDVRKVLDINVLGTINVIQATARAMQAEGKGGAIVNSASMAGVAGAANMLAYSASKGAVISLTKVAAKDLAPLGIRVNSISPAFIGPGAMWSRQVDLQARAGSSYYSTDPDEVAEEMLGQVPLRRLGSVNEVASVVAWLLSDEASYVTGENVLVTGGIA